MASPIKRTRRTKTEVAQLERQIYEVLALDHPQSVRHVFYLMTDPRLPVNALRVAKITEASERAQLMHMAEMLNGGGANEAR